MMRRLASGLAIALSLVATSFAPAEVTAQEKDPKAEAGEEAVTPTGRRPGLDGRFGIKGSFNLVSNSNVIGQNDGTSLLLSGSLLGGLDFIEGRHEVRNTLTWNTSWARTPVIDEFVKNYDTIELEDIYSYYVTEWFGPYGRLSFKSSLFETNRVTADQRDYAISRLDGSTDTQTTDRLELADPFEPFELTQSVGLFTNPVREQAIDLSLRVGFGARQALAEGTLVVQDDEATDVIEVVEIDDAIQAGFEGFLGVEGDFPEQRTSYRAGFEALIPVANNDDTGRSGLELTRWGLNAGVTYSMFDWLGLSYDLRLLRDPQLLDKTQVQNSVLLTFQYTFFEQDEADEVKPKEKPSEEAPEEEKPDEEAPEDGEAATEGELEQAIKRAEAAEREAESARDRAEDAEEQVDSLQEELEQLRREQEQQRLQRLQEERDQQPQEEQDGADQQDGGDQQEGAADQQDGGDQQDGADGQNGGDEQQEPQAEPDAEPSPDQEPDDGADGADAE
jgi:hypothetical protein